ncbi:MAG TPA: phosphoenolpyruvate mutase [Vicinamibacterales bacterium]|nr:phosphoenolpyruvate mutase [Vicinamibacterales bacterium]
MTRAFTLRTLLFEPDLALLMEAHNALSARIAEEAGFRALWASGLTMSAALGVRDANEASWTQILDVLEFMADATTVPILMDGDTGFGNFNNVRRLVTKLEARGIAGVCLEDKLFPKMNSFLHGESQPLADVEEFSGRIRAAKDTQRDADFVVVARTEAFIAGHGLSEALVRANAYANAGADAILIHSAKSTPSEVLAFIDAWNRDVPVLAVPTKYCHTPTEVFRQHGFAALIWANHLLRASIRAMQDTAAEILAAQSVSGIDASIVPVGEVFRLQRVEELDDAERRYLDPAAGDRAVLHG